MCVIKLVSAWLYIYFFRIEATRMPSMYGNQWPEHTAMARWPSLAFAPTPQSLRENSIRRPPLPPEELRAKTLREYAITQRLPPPVSKDNFRRNRSSPDGGTDNPAYLRTENDVTYLRLASDNGSDVYDADLPPFPPPQPPPQPKLVRNRSSLYNDYPGDMPKLSSRTEAKIEANVTRPHSLHEAIINRPPLRHVPRQRKESSSNVWTAYDVKLYILHVTPLHNKARSMDSEKQFLNVHIHLIIFIMTDFRKQP